VVVFPGLFEFDYGAEVDRVVGAEICERQRLELLNGLLNLAGLADLRFGEVRGFEAAGVVFVFGFALFVGSLGVGRPGGAQAGFEFDFERGNDGFDDRMFVRFHLGWERSRESLVGKISASG
jgi:hypothetical protein